jgi:hypothetical protein
MPWSASLSLPAAQWPRELDWQGVHIEQVEVGAGHPAAPDHRCVRAIVHLDGLTPADVRVLLLPITVLADDAPSGEPIARLWSVRSLANGSYVFEASVPAGKLAGPRQLKVHVGPANDSIGGQFSLPPGCWHRLPTSGERPTS